MQKESNQRYCIIHPGLIGTPKKWFINLSKLPSISKNDKVDLYVHTWEEDWNLKNLSTFCNLYGPYFNLKIITERYQDSFIPNLLKYSGGLDPGPTSGELIKKFAIFHSLYAVCNNISDINQYRFVIKAQCHLSDSQIYIHSPHVQPYPEWADNAANAYPLLEGTDYREFVYSILTFNSANLRQFYSGPAPLVRTFVKPFDTYLLEVSRVFKSLVERTKIIDFEGSMLLKELFERSDVKMLSTGGIKTGNHTYITPHMTPAMFS